MTAPTTAAPAAAGKPKAGGGLKDKRVLYGAGAIVAVAAFALYKRGQSGSTAAAAGSGTTGTDIASMLSDYNAQNQAALEGYVQQVKTLVGSVQGGTTSTGGAGAVQPGGNTPAKRGPYKPQDRWQILYGPTTVGQLARKLGISVASLQRLNSKSWKSSTPLHSGTRVKIGG